MKYNFWISLSFAEIAIIVIINNIFNTNGGILMEIKIEEIITLVTAIVIFTGNIISIIWTYRKDSARAKQIHTDLNQGNEKLNNKIESEYKDLSKNLSENKKELTSEHKDILKNIQSTKDKVNQIFSFQEKEAAIRQEASKHMPKETQLENLVKEVFENNRNLRNDIIRLENALAEKEQLLKQKQQLILEQQKIIENQNQLKKIKRKEQEIIRENTYTRDDFEYDR